MGMTSERAIHILEQRACCRECVVENCTCAECDEAFDMAISTMRKYQKITEIVTKWHNDLSFKTSMAMTEIEEVVEDGKVDRC